MASRWINYDRMAPDYDRGRALSLDALEDWRKALVPYLGSPAAGGAVIDVGSGTGIFAEAIATWFDVTVVGIEPSLGMRTRAAAVRPLSRGGYVAGEAEHLPLRGAACRAAWLSTVVHHIPNVDAAATELRRVLGPGAPVLIRNAFPGRFHNDHWLRYFGQMPTAPDGGRFPSVEEVVASFARAGFAMERLEPVAQRSASSLRELADRVRTRADTTLTRMSDEQFSRGLRQLEEDAAAEGDPLPIVDYIDLLVLR